MDVVSSILTSRGLALVVNPAADTEWVYTVGAEEEFTAGQLLLKCVTAQIVQGATQTPQPVLVIDNGSIAIEESVGATSAQPANSTCTYSWAPSLLQSGIQPAATASADLHAQAPLPLGDECILLPGWRVRSHTLGIGAGTQWQNIVLYVVGIG